ncbi:MAG: TonB-dependent receptor plug domain-containing protein [Wolinella sp.]
MKKNFIYLSLCVCMALHASEQLETITITSATKSEKNVDGVVSSVIVLTEKDIQKSHAGRLRELLKNAPSLTLQNGAFPSVSAKNKSAVSIRGIGAAGTLFLIDGKRLAGEVKNPYDLDRIPVSMIERVEIIKGPASALYGADAMGGVINIITKKPTKELEGSIGLQGSSNYQGKGAEGIFDLDLRGRKEGLSYSFGGSLLKAARHDKEKFADVYVRAGGLGGALEKPENSGNNIVKNSGLKNYYNAKESQSEEARVSNLNARLQYEVSDSFTLGGDLGYLKEEREGRYVAAAHKARFGYAPIVHNIPVRSKDENQRLNVGIDTNITLMRDLKLYARIYQSLYKKRNNTTALVWKSLQFPNEAASGGGVMNANVKITSYESYLQYLLLNTHLLTLGGEYRDEKREATVFRQDGAFDTRTVGYKALYLQEEWAASDNLNILVGARYDDISNAKSKVTFKFGINYALNEQINLRSSFSQGYRSADIRELYMNRQTPTGRQFGAEVINPPFKWNIYNLKPESINAYEAGISGRTGGFGYDVALFYNDLKDKIEMVKRGTLVNSYFTFENIADAYTAGIEANLSYALSEDFLMKLSWSELKSENKADKKKLLLTPDRAIVLKSEYQTIPNLFFSMSVRHIGAQDYMLSSIRDSNKRKKAKANTFVDLGADYMLSAQGRYRLFMGIDNILNEKVDEHLLSDRGCVIHAGLRYFF